MVRIGRQTDPVFTAAGLDANTESRLGMSLSELSLSVRAMNCLESESIRTVRDLVQRTEDQLLEVREGFHPGVGQFLAVTAHIAS